MIVAVPGQPGLFRQRGFAGLEGQRTALEARVREVEDRLGRARTLVASLLEVFPGALNTRKVESAWQILRRIPQPSLAGSFFTMSQETAVSLIKAVLLSSANNLDLSRTLLGMPPLLAVTDAQFERNAPKVRRLLDTTSAVLGTLEEFLDAVQTVSSAPERAARAVGLGNPAAIIGVAVVLVGGAVSYLLWSQLGASIDANVSALEACLADAAAGIPCTGQSLLEYQRRAADRASSQGIVPQIGGAVRDVGEAAAGAISATGIIVGVGVLAGLYFLAQPAQLARARAAAADYGSRARARFSRA